MGVFIILLFVPILMQHVVIGNKCVDLEKKNNCALLFFFLFLTALIALRHETIGNDTSNYIYYFEQFCKTPWNDLGKEDLEIGFAFFNKIVSVFTKDPQVFLSVAAALIIAAMYPTYRRLCVDASLTIVLFCTMSTFVMMFSGVRQVLAIAIGFIAYECTRRKKLLPFLACVVVAVLFHTSAFILIIMYPLYHAKITKTWLFFVVPAIVVVFIFNQPIFTVLSLFIEQYTEYEASIMQTGAYTMIILFVLFAAFSFLIPEEESIDDETRGLRNFLLLALVLQLFAPLHTLAMRMNYYYIIFIPLLLPRIISHKSEQWHQVAVVGRYVMLVFFAAYFFVSASGGGALHTFPYHFFWESV